jgi:hypothetical protein
MRLEHLLCSLIRMDLADSQNFGTRGSEVQILSPRPFLFSNLQNGQVMRVYTKGFTLTRLTACPE